MLAQTIKTNLDQLGATVYIGFFPAKPDTALVVRETAGFAADPKFAYDFPGLQIITRSKDYVTAYNLSQSGYGLLQGNNTLNTLSGETWIVDITASQAPYYAGRDDFERHTFTQNFEVHYLNTFISR